MCRLLIMTGIQNPELAEKMMRQAKNPMSIGNNMGIGFSAVKQGGDFFTERWHKNDMFMDDSKVLTPDIIQQLEPFKDRLPKLEQNYSLFGDRDFSKITSVTMHTRYATCGREFMNTHPFVDNDHSLVHNGVIYNHRTLGLNKISECDSEAALQSYINHGVGHDIQNTQAWLDSLSGYWAFGIFSRDGSGTRILDIIRNDATLYATTVEGLGLVLATTPDIITSSLLACGVTLENQPELMRSNIMYRFNAETGEMISKLEVSDSKLNTKVTTGFFNTTEYQKITGKTVAPIQETPLRSAFDFDSFEDSFNTGDAVRSDYHLSGSELFEYLDDVNIPLRDRLDVYDAEFETEIGYQFDKIPSAWRNNEWQFDDIFDVAEEIEIAYEVYSGGGVMKRKS